MCTPQQCIERLTEATPYIRKEFEVKSLCIFGSMARGDNEPNSDVDVCVEMPPKMRLVLGLKRFLEELFGCYNKKVFYADRFSKVTGI